MHVAVVGAGLVGQRAATMLAERGTKTTLVGVTRTPEPLEGVDTAVGWAGSATTAAPGADVVVLATESDRQPALAAAFLQAGAHVVSTADERSVIAELWSLDALAREQQRQLVVGAAYSPGLSSLLVACLVRRFDTVSTISTARFGTGGPRCAHDHHAAAKRPAAIVRHNKLETARAGTGRGLVWFPEPAGPADCYHAGSAEPFLLHQAFPDVDRIDARQAATRRDRLTVRLPMLRTPHAEGKVGAVWVEVRGRRDGAVEHRALAATAPQATGAAAMAVAMVENVANVATEAVVGVTSTAMAQDPVAIGRSVSRNVCLWAYDGSQHLLKNVDIDRPQAARKWTRPQKSA